MVSSAEIYDPRLNAWRMGDPMTSPRGYAAAVNLDGSVYLIGGLQSNVQILDTVNYHALLISSCCLTNVVPVFSWWWLLSFPAGWSLQPKLRMVSSRFQLAREEVLCICRRHVVRDQELSVHSTRFNVVLPFPCVLRVVNNENRHGMRVWDLVVGGLTFEPSVCGRTWRSVLSRTHGNRTRMLCTCVQLLLLLLIFGGLYPG